MSSNNPRVGAYSLWAHIESKECYPDSVLRGWRQQRKELEKKAEVEKAFQATQAEAIRKAQKSKEVPPSTFPPPTLGPSIPISYERCSSGEAKER